MDFNQHAITKSQVGVIQPDFFKFCTLAIIMYQRLHIQTLSVFILILMASFQVVPKPDTLKWVISKSSYLQVKGSTNVNKFSCVIANYCKPDTLTLQNLNNRPVSLTGAMALSVHDFDCHNAMMTADLRKTLKANQFPKLYVRFINLESLPHLSNENESIKGWVEIQLAQQIKRYQVAYQVSKDAHQIIHLYGVQEVLFSDFKIDPPRKLGGMIKTNDALEISFQLYLKQI